MDIMMRLKGAGFSEIALAFRQREAVLGHGLPLLDFVDIVLPGLLPKPRTREEKRANIHALIDLFEAIDINGDGTLEFDEFTSFCVDAGMLATRVTTANLKHRYVRHAQDSIKTTHGRFGIERLKWCAQFERFLVIEHTATSVKLFTADGKMVADVRAQSSWDALLLDSSRSRDGADAVFAMDDNANSYGNGNGSRDDQMHRKLHSQTQTNAMAAESRRAEAAMSVFILDAVLLFPLQCLAMSTTDFVISFYSMEAPRPYMRSNVSSANVAMSAMEPACDILPKLTITTTNAQPMLRYCEHASLLLSSGSDFVVNVWKIVDRESKALCHRLALHQHMVTDVIEIPVHDLLVSCDLNRELLLWDINDCRARGALLGHTHGIKQLVYSKDHDLLLSAGFEFDALAWDVTSRQIVLKLVGHRAPLVGIQLASFQSERAVTADETGIFKVWDISRGNDGLPLNSSASSNARQGNARGASYAIQLESIDPSHQFTRFQPTCFVCLQPLRRDIWAAAAGSATLHLFRSMPVQKFEEIPLKAFYHYNANRFVVVSGPVCSVWDGESGACVDEFSRVGGGYQPNGTNASGKQRSHNHNGSSANTSNDEGCSDILQCTQDAKCKKLVAVLEDGELGVFNCQNFVQMRRCEERFRTQNRTQATSAQSVTCGIVGLHYCSDNKLIVATDMNHGAILVIDDSNSDMAKGVKESNVLRRLTNVPGGVAASAYNYHASMIATLAADDSNYISLWDFETLSLLASCERVTTPNGEELASLHLLEFWDEYPVLIAADAQGIIYFFAVMPMKQASTGQVLHVLANDHNAVESNKSPEESSEQRTEDESGGVISNGAAEMAARKLLMRRKTSGRHKKSGPGSQCAGAPVTCMKVVHDDAANRFLLFTGDDRGVLRVWELSAMMQRLSLFKIPESKCKFLRRGYHPRAVFVRDFMKDVAGKPNAPANLMSLSSTSDVTAWRRALFGDEADTRFVPTQNDLKRLSHAHQVAKKRSSVAASTALSKILPGNRVAPGRNPPPASAVAAAEAFLLHSPTNRLSGRRSGMMNGSTACKRSNKASPFAVRSAIQSDPMCNDVNLLYAWTAHADGLTSLEVTQHPNIIVTCAIDMRVFVWSWQGACLGKLFDADNTRICRWRFCKDDSKRQEERQALVQQILHDIDLTPAQKAQRERDIWMQSQVLHQSQDQAPLVNFLLLDHLAGSSTNTNEAVSNDHVPEPAAGADQQLKDPKPASTNATAVGSPQGHTVNTSSSRKRLCDRTQILAQVRVKSDAGAQDDDPAQEAENGDQFLDQELVLAASAARQRRRDLRPGSVAAIKNQIHLAQRQAEDAMENQLALEHRAANMYSNLQQVQRKSASRRPSRRLNESLLLAKANHSGLQDDDSMQDRAAIAELLKPSEWLQRRLGAEESRPQTAPISPLHRAKRNQIETTTTTLLRTSSEQKIPKAARPQTASALQATTTTNGYPTDARKCSLDQAFFAALQRNQRLVHNDVDSTAPSDDPSAIGTSGSMDPCGSIRKLKSINDIIAKTQEYCDAATNEPSDTTEAMPAAMPTLQEDAEMVHTSLHGSVSAVELRQHMTAARVRMEIAMREEEHAPSQRGLLNKQRLALKQHKKVKRMEEYLQQKRRELNTNIGSVFMHTSFVYRTGTSEDRDKVGSPTAMDPDVVTKADRSKVFGIYGAREVMSVIRLFWRMDQDGSGHISLPELLDFKQVFEKLGFHDMTTIFQAIDKDGSGDVTMRELLEICFHYASKTEIEEMLKLAKMRDLRKFFRASKARSTRTIGATSIGDTTMAHNGNGLSKEQRAELLEIFRVFDKNGDGTVSVEELMEALRVDDDEVMARVAAAEQGRRRHDAVEDSGLSKEDVEQLFREFDSDGSKALEFEEFVGLMQSLYSRPIKQQG